MRVPERAGARERFLLEPARASAVFGGRARRTTTRLAAIALALSTTACSLIANNGPKFYNPPGSPAAPCGTSRVAPVADTLLAIYMAIPTVVGVAVAWDDPVWEHPDDGEGPYAGGSQIGVYLGVPFGALLALAVTSAASGFRAANRCEAARARASTFAPENPHTVACRATFQALADARLAYADPLPAWCSVELANEAFLLDDAGVATDTFAGRSLKVRLAGTIAVAVEIERPRLPLHWRDILGEPDARLDDGTWVYAARGLALTLDGDAVVRAIVFSPTTVDGYRAHYAPAPLPE